MIWANSFLPVFIGGSGCVTPGIRPEPHFAVQIDTTLHRPETPFSHGFQRFALSFNRTAVRGLHNPGERGKGYTKTRQLYITPDIVDRCLHVVYADIIH
jgi:hypothetical protein